MSEFKSVIDFKIDPEHPECEHCECEVAVAEFSSGAPNPRLVYLCEFCSNQANIRSINSEKSDSARDFSACLNALVRQVREAAPSDVEMRAEILGYRQGLFKLENFIRSILLGSGDVAHIFADAIAGIGGPGRNPGEDIDKYFDRISEWIEGGGLFK